MGIYEEWGVEPVINASGAVTRLGGAPMPPAVLEAFVAAAGESVCLDRLQGAASRYIRQVTGAEAGLVTCGCAAALTLGTAAILAGQNLRRIESLPNTAGFPDEFVMAREQRNGYDHAVRAAGARLVEVGFHELVAGAGVRRAESWEYAAAFGPATAGVLYVYDAKASPPLQEVVDCAHARGIPVLVDAAAELPTPTNLQALLGSGADLVAISGGKGLRGPQSTGILCGRRDLVGSAAMQMLDLDDHFELWDPPPELIDKADWPGLPRHGIGRALKVSKEEIVALLTALRLFVSGEHAGEPARAERQLEQIAGMLSDIGCEHRFLAPQNEQSLPLLEIEVAENAVGRTAFEVCQRLRWGRPAVQVNHSRLREGKLLINPLHLTDERTAILCQRLREELAPSAEQQSHSL